MRHLNLNTRIISTLKTATIICKYKMQHQTRAETGATMTKSRMVALSIDSHINQYLICRVSPEPKSLNSIFDQEHRSHEIILNMD